MMEEYIYKGNYEGYEVYISYGKEGLSVEEAYALYREACRSPRYRNLVEIAESRDMVEHIREQECKEAPQGGK